MSKVNLPSSSSRTAPSSRIDMMAGNAGEPRPRRRFRAEHADLGAVDRAFHPGLALLHMLVGAGDGAVGRLVERAGRMQMIADRASGALREHGAALVEQRFRLLVAADLAPQMVELAGHAEELDAQRIDVAGADRKMLVAPEGGRQRFDLEMAEIFQNVAAAAPDMTEIEEQRTLGIALARCLADPLEESRSGSAR